MWEQISWVLVSVAGGVLVWLPGLPGKTRTLANWAGIVIFSMPWFWLPFTAQPRASGLLGLVLAAAGIFFLIFGLTFCVRGTRRILTSVGSAAHAEPSRLVTDGTYGLVRHPVYSGLFLGMLGWSLIWGGVVSLMLTPVLYLLFRLEASLEEKLVLEKKFGQEYLAYRERVPAFFTPVLAIALLGIALLILLSVLLSWIPLA